MAINTTSTSVCLIYCDQYLTLTHSCAGEYISGIRELLLLVQCHSNKKCKQGLHRDGYNYHKHNVGHKRINESHTDDIKKHGT